VVAALRSGIDALTRLGGASLGDKTMLDAAIPFADELQARLEAGDPPEAAAARACAAARRAAEDTANLVARLGRARAHGDRSLGTPDAGAVSFALVAETAVARLASDVEPNPQLTAEDRIEEMAP
jgi:dihydroxyacetone kinase